MSRKSIILRFRTYLKDEKKLAVTTCDSYTESVSVFFDWIEIKKHKGKVNYSDAVDFVEWLRKMNYSHGTILIILNSLKHYFNFKKYSTNPIQFLNIQGRQKKVIHGILEDHQIVKLYNKFKGFKSTDVHLHRRNIAIIGIICFQGIKTEEIGYLKLDDISLDELTIKIPSTKKSNGRTLHLRSEQIIGLFEYLNQSREMLINKLNHPPTEYLFFSGKEDNKFPYFLGKTVKQLRNELDYFYSFQQIRNSRIVLWIKNNNLRIVQYMAGHKYISSTEKFKVNDISKLKEKIMKNHPLN